MVPASLILPPPTGGASPSVTLFDLPPGAQARYLTVSPAGAVAYALFQGDAWQGLQTCTVDTAAATLGTGHCAAPMTVGTAPSALQWAPDGSHLLVESRATGQYDLHRLDPTAHTSTPLTESAP